ncbi:transposase [Streptomyces erythrochromogenes]|uniref:transposase n=1 Tax=Streptomyces erythrochromogenes TaxID=285574 RepID=UPI0036A9EB01
MTHRDLTDAEWWCLEPLLPRDSVRGGRSADHRRVVNGIMHRSRTGMPWRAVPKRFGPWTTMYQRQRRWAQDGTWERLLVSVREAEQELAASMWPSSEVSAGPAKATVLGDEAASASALRARGRALQRLSERLADVVRDTRGHGWGRPADD